MGGGANFLEGFLGGGGVKPRTFHGGGHRYFLEEHILVTTKLLSFSRLRGSKIGFTNPISYH